MAKAIETLSIKLDFKAGSGSQQIIDKIGNSIKNLKVIAGQTGPSVDKVRRSINDFTKQGNRSISTIEGQVTALRALRREADINSKEFKELTADIGRYEKQLNKAQGRRGGGGGRQATQVAGAVISGGIFGGPEGAIGGALGAFGGVQGAFAGAAIGAQVGGIRKAIAASADYAAQIGKLKIALDGVTDTSDEYTSALATAARVSAQLNVPQEQAIRGVTRLAAAVKGAGGPITDAETTFRNVTAAIKATGGSTEDVKGAITAMVQVFSKGKVSAEELSGQLGERLPGAVTMFAKANKMTLPELQKNLKAGTVGLNELMNFIVELGVEFDGTAKKIASSNEEAGSRLTLAFDNMKAKVGEALIETGAELQNTFASFINDITPTLVLILPVIAKAFAAVAKSIDKIVVAAAAALAVLAVGKIAAIVASIGGLSAAIFTLKLNAIVAAKALVGLNAAALLNPYTALAAGAAALAVNIYNASEEQKRLNLLLREGSVAEIDKRISEKELLRAEAETRTLKGGEGGAGSLLYDFKGSDPGMVGFSRERDEKDIARLDKELPKLKAARETAVYNRDQGAPIPANRLPRFKYDPVTTEDGSGGGKGSGSGKGKGKDKTQARIDRADEIVRRLRDQLAIAQEQTEVGRFLAKQAKERSDQQAKFVKLQKDGKEAAITEAQIAAQQLLSDKQKEELNKRVNDLYEQASKGLKDTLQTLRDKVIADKEYARLIAEGVNPELAKELISINKIFEAGDRKLKLEIIDLETKKAKAVLDDKALQSINDQIEAIQRKREALGQDRAEAEGAAGEADKQPTAAEGLKSNIADLKKELDELLDPVNQITGAANAIGTAFTDSFKSVIDGSATTQEALAGFFKNIGNYFLDMAMQIIQKMITMYILNQAVRLLPGLSGGGGSKAPALALSGFAANGAYFDKGVAEFAKGGVSAKNKIVPYAKGGIVDKPTMFAYANGGAGRFGLMGEAGPEAIMPLQRGPGGKLGVQASGGGASNVVVNVDASGSSVEGDEPNASQLGKAIGAAVQAELIKQKRPGGLLTR